MAMSKIIFMVLLWQAMWGLINHQIINQQLMVMYFQKAQQFMVMFIKAKYYQIIHPLQQQVLQYFQINHLLQEQVIKVMYYQIIHRLWWQVCQQQVLQYFQKDHLLQEQFIKVMYYRIIHRLWWQVRLVKLCYQIKIQLQLLCLYFQINSQSIKFITFIMCYYLSQENFLINQFGQIIHLKLKVKIKVKINQKFQDLYYLYFITDQMSFNLIIIQMVIILFIILHFTIFFIIVIELQDQFNQISLIYNLIILILIMQILLIMA